MDASLGKVGLGLAEADIAQKRNVLIALRSADLKTDDIPPPFGVLHTALVTDRAAIIGALDKMGIAPSGIPAGPASLRSEPVSRRASFVGLAQQWSRRVALAGSHGKTGHMRRFRTHRSAQFPATTIW